MTVSVVVPRGGHAHDTVWPWVEARWAHWHPDWQIIEGWCDGPWHKGVAVADGLTRADGDVIVLADADSWCAHETMIEAVAAAELFPWVQPHLMVARLTDRSTHVLLGGPPVDVPRRPQVRRHLAPVGGGIVVARRHVFDLVPYDPRFVGWGGEDISYGRALDTLVGVHRQFDGVLWHAYHRPQASYRHALPETETLANRYLDAHGDPAKMVALVQEGSRWVPSPS